MTDQTAEYLLTILSGMPSSAPWSKAAGLVYVAALGEVADDIANATIRQIIQTESWRPAPARFLEVAREMIAAELPPLPYATDILVEIRTHVCYHGVRAGREADISHPLVNRIVDQLGGWAGICRMRDGELDTRMPGAYETCANEWKQQKQNELISLSPDARKAQIEAWVPVLGKRDRRSLILDPASAEGLKFGPMAPVLKTLLAQKAASESGKQTRETGIGREIK